MRFFKKALHHSGQTVMAELGRTAKRRIAANGTTVGSKSGELSRPSLGAAGSDKMQIVTPGSLTPVGNHLHNFTNSAVSQPSQASDMAREAVEHFWGEL